MKHDNETEEKIVTLECTLAELGYTVKRGQYTNSSLVVSGEILILADEVELMPMSDSFDDWGYRANLLNNGNLVASLNRWTE